MRTQLASLIVVKQEFPNFSTSIADNNYTDIQNNSSSIKSENDCNNNISEDLNYFSKKSKEHCMHDLFLKHLKYLHT